MDRDFSLEYPVYSENGPKWQIFYYWAISHWNILLVRDGSSCLGLRLRKTNFTGHQSVWIFSKGWIRHQHLFIAHIIRLWQKIPQMVCVYIYIIAGVFAPETILEYSLYIHCLLWIKFDTWIDIKRSKYDVWVLAFLFVIFHRFHIIFLRYWKNGRIQCSGILVPEIRRVNMIRRSHIVGTNTSTQHHQLRGCCTEGATQVQFLRNQLLKLNTGLRRKNFSTLLMTFSVKRNQIWSWNFSLL